MGENQFMDLTSEEYKALYTGLNPKTERNPKHLLGVEGVAASIDWRQKGAVAPIKDQGQCGSCWAFSAVGALEGASALFGSGLQSFSEQQLVDCSAPQGNAGCNGGWMDNAFKYVIANGISTEDQYPYRGRTQSCKAKSGSFKISSFVDIEKDNVDQLAAAVSKQPVSIAVDANNFQFYSSGVFSNCGTQLDHGVTLVGYTSDAWLVRNSWGTGWGE